MALCHFPVNLHTVPSSSSSSSLHPLLYSNLWIRKLRFHPFSHAVQLSAIRAAVIDIDTHPKKKKKKRKPKPGFFEEISDKWSSRISPKDGNFPWQKKHEEQTQPHHQEEEEVNRSSELTGKITDSNLRYSFPRPSGYMSAPWVNDNVSKPVKDESFKENRYRKENALDLDDDGRGMVVESGRDKGVWRSRKSNTVVAEKIVPEHELSRLRSVALRMVERVKVGS
ncbi:hypothetical protein F2Q69_00057664 [Brassica cretica]|uniref:Uncharacterized protein n=1 Tax=Brassica cretica TaxID=69181 RepID=A0A8S9MYU4_BRACR|nr:hypothetical protein F2Q69_00057664 [Brassica cretica]